MGVYFDEVKKPENLPSWLGLFGIILSGLAILFLVLDRNEKSNIEEIQSLIIGQLETTGSATIEEVLPVAESKGYSAKEVKSGFYDLVAKRIILKTSVGFEVKTFTTRLFDEIDLIIVYEYFNNNGDYIKSADEFDTAVLNVMCELREVEQQRKKNNYSDEAFISYLTGIEWYVRESFYKRGVIDKSLGFSVKKANKSMQLTQETYAAN